MTIEYVDSLQVLRFIELISAKRFAIKNFHDSIIEEINRYMDSNQDISGKEYSSSLKNLLLKELSNITKFKDQEHDVSAIGFPIKYNKTANQITMALEWLEEKEDDILSDLAKGILYNGLTNQYSNALPRLGLNSSTTFWGNENHSVSSVLLWSVQSTMSTDSYNSADFYPFYDQNFTPKNTEELNSIFLTQKGMYLFGDYQFGGHRYFGHEYPGLGQKLTYAEDCSSAVAKASCLNNEQIRDICTSAIKEYYRDNNSALYGFSNVTSSDGGTLNFEAIRSGDILVFGGHTGIVGNKDYSNLTLLEFTRDIDTEGQKKLGGGVMDYQSDFFTTLDQQGKYSYILRPNCGELKESCSVIDSLVRAEEWLNRNDVNGVPYYKEGSLLPYQDIECKISGADNDI